MPTRCLLERVRRCRHGRCAEDAAARGRIQAGRELGGRDGPLRRPKRDGQGSAHAIAPCHSCHRPRGDAPLTPACGCRMGWQFDMRRSRPAQSIHAATNRGPLDGVRCRHQCCDDDYVRRLATNTLRAPRVLRCVSASLRRPNGGRRVLWADRADTSTTAHEQLG
jgi:hypothetical protein